MTTRPLIRFARGNPLTAIRYSIVIPAYNAAHTITAGLHALQHQTIPHHQYEIIVVDDGSTNGTAGVVEQFEHHWEASAGLDEPIGSTNPPAVAASVSGRHALARPPARPVAPRLLRQPQQGAAAARNAGARAARGDVVAFLDADCVPAPDWLASIVSPLTADGVAGAGGRVTTEQRGLIPRFIQVEYDARYDRIARFQHIDFVSSATAAYDRAVFHEVGGFDIKLLGAEDVDLSFRLTAAGHRLVFVPEAVVYHTHPESLSAYVRRKFKYACWRAAVYSRHPGKVAGDSRTPQTQKLQIVLAPLIVLGLAGGLLWPPLMALAGLAAGAFLMTAGGTMRRGWRVDPVIGLASPVLLFASAGAAGAGLILGFARRRIVG